jgi:maltose-binding protein MalE
MMAGAGEALATLPATARPRATATIPIMGGEEAVPLVTATGFYLAAASTQADAASVFLREYLLRTSTMDAFFAAEAGPPAFLATADAEDVAAATAAFRDSAETGVAVPPIPQIDGVLDVLRTAFSALYDRENDPEQVLSGAAGAIRVLVGGGPGDDG